MTGSPGDSSGEPGNTRRSQLGKIVGMGGGHRRGNLGSRRKTEAAKWWFHIPRGFLNLIGGLELGHWPVQGQYTNVGGMKRGSFSK